ncbi:hypothetical protein FGLOB1_2508 [Fusarium globosum]|uniref:F-box domain-containing protein n=1 Tax=Fusarium globosum TaxID=78864 RepID=A0A8H5YSM5_9HYPO|nr:hypothetical protein FGLOB1_2508 [Fusarium globosum]
MSPTVSSNRWTPPQKPLFMQALCEAHRSGELTPGEDRELRGFPDSPYDRPKENFPSRRWDSKMVESRYKRVVSDDLRPCKIQKVMGCRSTEAEENIAGVSRLDKMPSEILFMIGSYLTHRQSGVYSAVSKRFRSLLGTQHLTAIRLVGTLEGLAKELRFFQELLELEGNVFTQTRHATFKITDIYEPKDHGGSYNASLTSDLIGSCIERLTGLRDVTFDLDLKGKSSTFKKHFRSEHKWKKPCNLIFHRANRLTFETIIRKFEPGTLETVQLPMKISRTYYDPLKTCHHPLKALHIFIPLQRSRYLQSPLRCMDPEHWNPIWKAFPQLESLVLAENPCEPGTCFKFDLHSLNKKVEVLTEALKSTERLRRFAFGLWSSRVPEFGMYGEWQPEPKLCAALDTWYINLLRNILAKAPHVDELCILDQNRFYRGTWSGDDMEIRALSFDDPGERDRFPNLLYGMALDFAYVVEIIHNANVGASKE